MKNDSLKNKVQRKYQNAKCTRSKYGFYVFGTPFKNQGRTSAVGAWQEAYFNGINYERMKEKAKTDNPDLLL